MRASSLPPGALAALAAVAVLALTACEGPKKSDTTMEVIQVESFTDEKSVTTLGLELKYAECPGDARRIVRADKAFAACASGIKAGDKLKAELLSTWQSDKGSYRTEIKKLGACALKQDAKDEANYEMVQICSDIVTTGAVVGVHCDRTRSKELIDKCPWLRRR